MNTFRALTLVAATVAMGLSAGLLYAYSVSVMPGLHSADNRTFIDVMQRINVAILNGWFALAFGGAPLLIGLAALLHLRHGLWHVLPWLGAALVLCLAGIVITIGFNVPLNDALAAAGNPAKITNLAQVREHFETTWVRLNVARTVVQVAALGVLAWALVLSGRATA